MRKKLNERCIICHLCNKYVGGVGMTEIRNNFENLNSIDVNFQRVETKFDQSERKSLMDIRTL